MSNVKPIEQFKIEVAKSHVEQGNEFIRKDNGVIKKLLPNLELAIKQLENFEVIKFNQLTQLVMINGKPLKESDKKKIRSLVGKKHHIDFSLNDIDDALHNIARERPYHPIKQMIERTQWDKVPRVETFFIDYLGAQDNNYIRTLTKRWLVGGVARIYSPGVKFEIVPIIQGAQGIGKSTMGKKLGGEYFTDTLKGMGKNKDDYQMLIGKWIVEISELGSMKESRIEDTKSFISAQSDNIRLPYSRITEEFPRTTIFFGTTNELTYLKDATGNRRFYPVKVTHKTPKDIHTITSEEVQQIWAEAYELFNNNEPIYYTQEENTYIDSHYRNEAIIEDDLIDSVSEYLEMNVPKDWNTLEKWHKKEVFNNGYYQTNQGERISGNNKIDKVSGREILETLGYEKTRSDFSYLVRKVNLYINSLTNWEKKKVYIQGKTHNGYERKNNNGVKPTHIKVCIDYYYIQ